MQRQSAAGACIVLLLVTIGAGCSGSPTGITPGSPIEVNWIAAEAAIAQLNSYRVAANTPPVSLDTALSIGCQAHANYLVLNGIALSAVGLAAHEEDSRLLGYSAIGELAGRNSVIYQGVKPAEAIDNWMATFYHRLGLLDPNLTRVGFGSAEDYQVMDVRRGRISGDGVISTAVLFPAPGMQDVPGQYKREIPHPIPADDVLGVPITVEFTGALGWEIYSVTSEIEDLDSAVTISHYLQTPGQPFLPEWDEPKVIALIPSSPLARGHTYRVSVSAEVDNLPWAAQWEFTTR